jgi:GNAT superfamily N-acetyltransferase
VGFAGVDGSCASYLYVAPDYYGRGIGRLLLNRALETLGPETCYFGLSLLLKRKAPYPLKILAALSSLFACLA